MSARNLTFVAFVALVLSVFLDWTVYVYVAALFLSSGLVLADLIVRYVKLQACIEMATQDLAHGSALLFEQEADRFEIHPYVSALAVLVMAALAVLTGIWGIELVSLHSVVAVGYSVVVVSTYRRYASQLREAVELVDNRNGIIW